MDIFFRFDKVRKGQKEFISDISGAIYDKKHLVAHAPTGLGKTDASISAALSYAHEADKTVFFLTPKTSQHRIAVDTLKEIVKKHKLDLTGADLTGKKNMCIHKGIIETDSENFYDLCQKMRKNETCPYYGYARGYSIKQKAVARNNFEKVMGWYDVIQHHEELKDQCASMGHTLMPTAPCAYETSMKIAKNADFIIGDYYHLLNKSISEQILEKTKKTIGDSIIIIDEAHNAPSRITASLTRTLDTYTLRKAQSEAKFLDQYNLAKFLRDIEKQINLLGNSMKKNEKLLFYESIPEIDLKMTVDLHELGLEFLAKSKKHVSYLAKISNFYESWGKESQAYLRLIKKWKRGQGYSIVHRCLDPSVFTKDFLDKTHSTILMSGTLKPQDMFRDLLGLEKERTLMKEYTSPFPKENRITVIDDSVTTKYTERGPNTYEKIASNCAKITNTIPGNSAIFFPSYAVMDKCLNYFEALSDKPIVRQFRNATPREAKSKLKRFKLHSDAGAVLVGVSGGSFSEGIDLPGKELLGVIVVGVPLAEPTLETRATIKYYDYKFNKGWEYGYYYPAITKAVQAAGRCVRSETDKGLIVFMDSRYRQSKYMRAIPEEYDLLVNQDPSSLLNGLFD